MSKLHERYPWIVSFSIALLFLVISVVGTPIGNQIEQAARLPVDSGVLIQQLLLTVYCALLVIVFGGWRQAGFFKRVDARTFLFFLPPLATPVIALFFTGIAPIDVTRLFMLVIFTVMIGFAEESLCRGVMLGAFLSRGAMKAAVYSSLIFGSMHLINVYYGMNIATGLLYVIYAALIGFGFAAPYLKSGGAIWPVIFVHGLYDFLGKIGHGWGTQALPMSSNETVFRLVMAILIGIYGFWVLKSNRTAPQTGALESERRAAAAKTHNRCQSAFGDNLSRSRYAIWSSARAVGPQQASKLHKTSP